MITSEMIDQASKELLSILKYWDSEKENNGSEKVDAFIASLRDANWTRRDIFQLLQRTCSEEFSGVPTSALSYIEDLESSVIGHVAERAIMRFKEDPTDDWSDLAKYVRSDLWK